jgi:hypothetical protein
VIWWEFEIENIDGVAMFGGKQVITVRDQLTRGVFPQGDLFGSTLIVVENQV